MINPFFGELFLYPIPLELSHNYCSNKCAYCFANLNNPGRTADVQKVANQLKKFQSSDNLTSLLLRSKAAVCISNKTDPFATSNYRIAIPEIKTMLAMDIPIAYHTRGGKYFDEFYSGGIPKSMFYISICQTDDAIRKKVEPGATSIEYRWDMAKQLIQDGHQVVIGLNPFVQEWINTETFIKNIQDAGVKNVVVQPIHLNNEQTKNMTNRELEAIGETVLANSKKRDSPYYYGVKILIERLTDMGINAYDTQNFNKTNIMQAWHKGLGGNTFKTYYDFYHWCLINKKNNDAVFFDEFYDFMKPAMFEDGKEYPIYQYITSTDRRYRKTIESGKEIKRLMTFKELCQIIWNDPDSLKNISRSDKFALVGTHDGGDLVLTGDDEDNLIYAFDDIGFEYRLINPEKINTY
jgi:DNA repair photolyase